MRNSEIKTFSIEQLKKTIEDEKNGLFNMKFAHAISPLENPSQLKLKRKFIAQLQTELVARTNA